MRILIDRKILFKAEMRSQLFHHWITPLKISFVFYGEHSFLHATSKLFLIPQIAIEHPVDAKFVREHTEISAPESVLVRHRDLAALFQCVRKIINFFLRFAVDADRKIVSL